MTFDILLNDGYDVELDDRNDLATVEGRRAVEQSIEVMVTSYFYEQIGSITAVNAVESLELQARRVAQDNPNINNLVDVSAERVSGTGGGAAIQLSIVYDTGAFDFEVTE